jgi:hypothetical protein
MFKKILTLSTLITCSISYSQNHVDALRFSLFNNYNTAGISALGGAGGLLSPSYNPASLAFFSGDKLLSLSLGNTSESVETMYVDETNTTKTPFAIAPFIQNIGYVSRIPFVTENDWNKFNMGFSFNRKHDFNKTTIINGYNTTNSMVDFFINNAQGLTPDELYIAAEENAETYYYPGDFAYQTWLINSDDDDNTNYYSNTYSQGQEQRMEINETGYINELDIAFSGAYKDFLFLGGSIGFTEIKFTQYKSYSESDFDQPNSTPSSAVESFEYNRLLEVEGEGVNFKFGSFIKPVSFLRIGWAYHSKTYTQLDLYYDMSMETDLIDGTHFSRSIYTLGLPNWSSYGLNSPAKSITSIGLIGDYEKIRILLTFDYEAIDYGSSQLNSTYSNYNFAQENEDISEFYTRTNNKKIGLSLSRNNISLRGGYSIFGSPFKENLNDGEVEYISAGIGYNTGEYSFSLAMIQSTKNEDDILYGSQISNIETNENTIIATCSYRF